MNWRIRQDSHLQTLRSKVLAHGHQDDCNFTTDAETKAEGRMKQDEVEPALRVWNHSAFFILPSAFKQWGRRRDSHSRGANARQFTKLLLSLLSHAGEMVGRHGPGKSRSFTIKVCNPDTTRRRS